MVRSEAGREIGQEFPQSREAYLKSFEEEWQPIHEGRMPETGLIRAGQEERKAVCEDVKLKNIEKGLFFVADGVSSAKGWFASRETARVMYEVLGESLDRHIENNLQEALGRGENPNDRITQYVAARMKAAVEQADHQIRSMAINAEFRGSGTTLSLVKLVKLPDPSGKGGHIQRMFFTNVGDSRIYLQRRDRRLERLTQDDSLLQLFVKRGELTAEEADQIDQVEDSRDLPPKLQAYATHGRSGIITKSIGLGESVGDLAAHFVDLLPGDRFVIVSDGVSDQLTEREIGRWLLNERDDNRAEGVLQRESMQMSLDGRSLRAKGDDISAVVYTLRKRGPDRSYLHPEVKKERASESRHEEMRKMREGLARARDRLRAIEAHSQTADQLPLKRDRIALMMKREQIIAELNLYKYHVERITLDLLEQELPPRFEVGEKVRMWRDDFDPPDFDRRPWLISAYQPSKKLYTVQGPGGLRREVSRYQLEKQQTGLLVRIGDMLPLPHRDGSMEEGFRVIAFDRNGNIVMAKEREAEMIHTSIEPENAQLVFLQQLEIAEGARIRMEQYAGNYWMAVENQKNLHSQAEEIAGLERRQTDERISTALSA